MIVLDDSLEQCLITSRGKTCKKNLETQSWAKTDQNQAQNKGVFLSFFQVWFISFPGNCVG